MLFFQNLKLLLLIIWMSDFSENIVKLYNKSNHLIVRIDNQNTGLWSLKCQLDAKLLLIKPFNL